MPKKQSKKRGKKKSRITHAHGKNRKREVIFNKFITYLKNKKSRYVKSLSDEYDCVTNPENSNYEAVKDAILKFIKENKLEEKDQGFDTSNVIEESLLDFIPLDCEKV